MAKPYESKKEKINNFLKHFSNKQIAPVPESIFIADIVIRFSTNKGLVMDLLENYVTLGLIDKDNKGYYGVPAKAMYDLEMKAREEELKKEVQNAPSTKDEAIQYVKSMKQMQETQPVVDEKEDKYY